MCDIVEWPNGGIGNRNGFCLVAESAWNCSLSTSADATSRHELLLHRREPILFFVPLNICISMADPPSPSSAPPSASTSAPPRIAPANVRRRGFPARAPLEGVSPDWPQRRNSTLSDSISEARNSIRSSTDDLFLPRVAKGNEGPVATEESHWHSAPLGLALLPAIAGVFFQDGGSFVTDVTLLVLAAIFLNWSVRLPW